MTEDKYMEKKVKRIALLSGVGDCPGLNAVIRTITKTAISKSSTTVLPAIKNQDTMACV